MKPAKKTKEAKLLASLVEAFREFSTTPRVKWADLRNAVPAAAKIEKLIRSTHTYEWKQVGMAHNFYRVELGSRKYATYPVATIVPVGSKEYHVSVSSGGRSLDINAPTLAQAKKKVAELLIPKE